MTLNDIIVSALAQLDRAHDMQTVEVYRTRLAAFANDAQNDLALTLALKRTDEVEPVDGVAELSALSRSCLRVEYVEQLGKRVPFRMGDSPDRLFLPYNERARITYRFAPKELRSATDISELPEAVHPLIVSYVVGRERMGGDVSTQGGGNIYLSMYNAAKAKLRGSLNCGDPYTITNRYE